VFDSPTFMPVDDAFDDGKANPCALIGIHAMQPLEDDCL
jgi:hypothetical protein